MKTIIVDHDLPTEILGHGRLNSIIPLIRTWGAENLYTPWANQTLDDGIITPSEVNLYLDSGYDIIYAVTARAPSPSDHSQTVWPGCQTAWL